MCSDKIVGDLRPSDHEYALLANQVYKTGKARPIANASFITEYRGWLVLMTRESLSGYFGAVYLCESTKQYVIAHRGTSSLTDLFEDLHGVILNQYSAQKQEAFLLVDLVIHQIRIHKPDYRISFTGHSLGAFLAELCVYYATHTLNFPRVNAVTFESPGSKQSMMSLQIQHDIIHLGKKEPIAPDEFKKLDIVTYLCYPNVVNSCNDHVGSVYAINVTLNGGMFANIPIVRLMNSHKMDGIVDWFKNALDKSKTVNYTRLYMANWPKGYKQLREFFRHAMVDNKMYSLPTALMRKEIPPPPISSREYDNCKKEDILGSLPSISFPRSRTNLDHDHSGCQKFEGWLEEQTKKIRFQYYGNFQVLECQSSFHILPLHHFLYPMQAFLRHFTEKMTYLCKKETLKDKVHTILKEAWKGLEVPDDIANMLLSFHIQVNACEIEEVVCGDKKVCSHDFRLQLSCWLEKTGFKVGDFLNETLIEKLATGRIKGHYDLPPIPEFVGRRHDSR
jgi:hypothetical protein